MNVKYNKRIIERRLKSYTKVLHSCARPKNGMKRNEVRHKKIREIPWYSGAWKGQTAKDPKWEECMDSPPWVVLAVTVGGKKSDTPRQTTLTSFPPRCKPNRSTTLFLVFPS
jgi:hypothetical protein